MLVKLALTCLASGLTSVLLLAGCEQPAGANAGGTGAAAKASAAQSPIAKTGSAASRNSVSAVRPAAYSDTGLEPFQGELLDLAFDAVSRMPLNPHIKNRSRAQDDVVQLCLELEQPDRARVYIEAIEPSNWLHGAGYADLAYYHAKRGEIDRVEAYLAVADEVAESVEDWRRDRIRVKAARTRELLGQLQAVAAIESDVNPFEMGDLVVSRVEQSEQDDFYEQLNALAELSASIHFDVKRIALNGLVELYAKCYADAEHRAIVQERVRMLAAELHAFLGLEALFAMAEAALKHGDQPTAMSLVDEARSVHKGFVWEPQDDIANAARLAGLRFRAGDAAGGFAEAGAAYEQFEQHRDLMENYKRASAVRPLAEAYHVMGETDRALELYGQAVEEGTVNPNARARALDLADTCCSMVSHGVRPDARLFGRLYEVLEGLDHPW